MCVFIMAWISAALAVQQLTIVRLDHCTSAADTNINQPFNFAVAVARYTFILPFVRSPAFTIVGFSLDNQRSIASHSHPVGLLYRNIAVRRSTIPRYVDCRTTIRRRWTRKLKQRFVSTVDEDLDGRRIRHFSSFWQKTLWLSAIFKSHTKVCLLHDIHSAENAHQIRWQSLLFSSWSCHNLGYLWSCGHPNCTLNHSNGVQRPPCICDCCCSICAACKCLRLLINYASNPSSQILQKLAMAVGFYKNHFLL